jgi:hypothetical protein
MFGQVADALDEGPLPIPLLEPLLVERLTKSAANGSTLAH